LGLTAQKIVAHRQNRTPWSFSRIVYEEPCDDVSANIQLKEGNYIPNHDGTYKKNAHLAKQGTHLRII